MRFALLSPLALSLAACTALHQPPAVRVQEAATELNVNTRFGRMELATESVAPTARDSFIKHRRAWGNDIRVADYDLSSLRVKEGDQEAETLVSVSWYRIDQGDLHQTTIKQSWKSFKGDWKLVDEARKDGDFGLLSEPTGPSVANATAGLPKPAPAQFPTIKLGEKPEGAPATIPPPESTGD
jgi:hypothetical protein